MSSLLSPNNMSTVRPYVTDTAEFYDSVILLMFLVFKNYFLLRSRCYTLGQYKGSK